MRKQKRTGRALRQYGPVETPRGKIVPAAILRDGRANSAAALGPGG
jgi:hypothetical protein